MQDSHTPKSRKLINECCVVLTMCLAFMLTATPPDVSADVTVTGSLIANGKTVELPYVYVWKNKEGFYDPNDPTWNIIFVERSLQPRELGSHVSNSAWVHIGITETKEFTEQGKLEVYTQSIKFSATAAGNVSGGNYPEIEIKSLGSDLVSGRVWHPKPQKVFDDSFQFDFAFSAPISDPNAPTVVGDPLPAGGGEPGPGVSEMDRDHPHRRHRVGEESHASRNGGPTRLPYERGGTQRDRVHANDDSQGQRYRGRFKRWGNCHSSD